jgi:hypothetical protein
MVGVRWRPWRLLVGTRVGWQVSVLSGADYVAGRRSSMQRCCVCLVHASQESIVLALLIDAVKCHQVWCVCRS